VKRDEVLIKIYLFNPEKVFRFINREDRMPVKRLLALKILIYAETDRTGMLAHPHYTNHVGTGNDNNGDTTSG
jgi:hypothetical protein